MADNPVDFSIKGRNRVLFALRRIGPEIVDETSKASGVIASRFVGDVRSAASTPREYGMVASGTVRKGLVPKVAFGGATLIASSSGGEPYRASDLFWGTEFGGRTKNYFLPWRGKGSRSGYVVYPTLRARGRRYAEEWLTAVDDVLDAAAKTSERIAAYG